MTASSVSQFQGNSPRPSCHILVTPERLVLQYLGTLQISLTPWLTEFLTVLVLSFLSLTVSYAKWLYSTVSQVSRFTMMMVVEGRKGGIKS